MKTRITRCDARRQTSTKLTCTAAVLLSLAHPYAGGPACGQAKSSSAAVNQQSQQIVISALLDTALDSKKSRTGTRVEAKTVQDLRLTERLVIPKESTVVGHVTNAKVKGKGDAESVLAIQFDNLISKDGKTISIDGHLRAVGPDPNSGQPVGGIDYGNSMDRGIERNQPASEAEPVRILAADSTGVEGIKNLGLDETTGLLRTGDKAVKLAHNSQMLIQATVVAGQ